MKRLLLVLTLVTALGAGAASAAALGPGKGKGKAAKAYPETIRLPDGFQPEGIAVKGNTFYVGSIPTGAIYRGNLRTGAGSVLVPGGAGKAAIGLDLHGGKLFVAGGATGKAFVYDAKSGSELAAIQLTTTTPTFVNDVVVTRNAAWFTDSLNAVLYRVALGQKGAPAPSAQTIPLTGDLVYTTGFNANGIEALSKNRLVVVQSNTGKLFTVTPTGATKQIVLAGGATVVNGDGLLLKGKTLYVVQNRDNKIAKVALSRNATAGRIAGYLTDGDLDVPTTLARAGSRLYTVNARFTTTPTPSTRYDVVLVGKSHRR